jgi:hypothetical protein
MWGMTGCKPPKPQVLRFPEGSRDGIALVRLIRRWATSDHAFRQRERFPPMSERKEFAKHIRDKNPEFAKMLLDPRERSIVEFVPHERRKRWSPHDPRREKDFSVRNAAKVVRQCLEITAPAF